MNKKLAIAMGVALAGMSSVATAESGISISGNVALTSDYVFRGVSQSDNNWAIQGGLDLEHTSGVYAGTWASSIDADTYEDAAMEIDFYVGWAGDVGPVGLDVGINYFYYPDGNDDDYNTYEGWVGVSKDFEAASVGLTLYYSDDFYGGGDATYIDLGAEVPVGAFTLAAHYGWTDVDCSDCDYEDWSIGASTEAMGLGFDLTYTDTDISDSDIADERLVFTVSKSL